MKTHRKDYRWVCAQSACGVLLFDNTMFKQGQDARGG